MGDLAGPNHNADLATLPERARRHLVTVDGPGGAGKSTVCRSLARRLGLPYLNSGYIYRTVTLLILEEGGRFEDRRNVERILRELDLRFLDSAQGTRVIVGDRDVTARLKAPDVTPQIYRVANDGEYRRLLVDLQRRCALPDGVVAEGRDMGTVIFPEAPFKFYLDASAEVRARRQWNDLRAAGHARDYEDVLAEVVRRDAHDRDRADAPLRVADGAEVLRTDDLSVDDVVALLYERVRSVDVALEREGVPEEADSGHDR